MRARPSHRALALLHLHHALLHGACEVLATLAHVDLRRRNLLNNALRKWMLAAVLPLRIELLIIKEH